MTEDPDYFSDLAKQQEPEYLWIGCSDSRVPATTVVDLPPGEIFVHRNVANLVHPADVNCLSVMQFAVDALKVKHIIVCGHYGCGGVAAAFDGKQLGLIDNWLAGIRATAELKAPELAALDTRQERVDRLCELNVIRQAINVCETTIVRDAWFRGQEVIVHSWIYGLSDGLVRDLDIAVSNDEDLKQLKEDFYRGNFADSSVKEMTYAP